MSDPGIRWLIRTDLPAVLAIESVSSESPWLKHDFVEVLLRRNCIGLVALTLDKIVGYTLYELSAQELRVLNLTVAPSCRRQGVGRALVEKLASKLSLEKRRQARVMVRESNRLALRFLSACGFRAVGLVRGYYDPLETDDDAIEMIRVASCCKGPDDLLPLHDLGTLPPV